MINRFSLEQILNLITLSYIYHSEAMKNVIISSTIDLAGPIQPGFGGQDFSPIL